MNYTGLISKLELAYAPLSNHDFTIVKSEQIIQEILKDSMLYVLAQRPILTFENITESDGGGAITFEICMQGNDNKLICELPYYQEYIGQDDEQQVLIEFGAYDPDWTTTEMPLFGVNGMKFFDHNHEFLLWLSPDKFLHLYWCNILTATIKGDIREFTKFLVHYVGKSTDQPVYDRLTGHYTLQEILSLERPLIKGSLPTHEITLLLFKIADVLEISIFGDDVETFIDNIEGKNMPDVKTISLDAEKALIKLLNPEYNHPTKRFPNYPKSTDGLYQYNFNRFVYQIKDDITLEYSDVNIFGNTEENLADIIAIEENETIEILKISELSR